MEIVGISTFATISLRIVFRQRRFIVEYEIFIRIVPYQKSTHHSNIITVYKYRSEQPQSSGLFSI